MENWTCLNSEAVLSVGHQISLEDLHNLDKNPLIHFKDSLPVLVDRNVFSAWWWIELWRWKVLFETSGWRRFQLSVCYVLVTAGTKVDRIICGFLCKYSSFLECCTFFYVNSESTILLKPQRHFILDRYWLKLHSDCLHPNSIMFCYFTCWYLIVRTFCLFFYNK